ncbi:MAG: flagellar biosynthetic protein FliO [Puniceicoccales bacterium]|jgi:flagellar biogenesis protein FliO|nr:flagellar biosynthetic protein FliO [Puniceicoccales bacterium]
MATIGTLAVSLPGEVLASPAQIGIAEIIVRTAIFLALLALGGYFFVLFHRRGYFCGCGNAARKRDCDDIKIIATRMLGGKKYLTVVEHFGKRFFLAATNDRIEKLSEWDIEKSE